MEDKFSKVEPPESFQFDYSIGVIATDPEQLRALKATLDAAGFGMGCEFIFIDNCKGNAVDAYYGANLLLSVSRGKRLIFCHQDVRFVHDDRHTLDQRLAELDELDQRWAVAGNAGGVAPGRLCMRISDARFTNVSMGSFPSKALGLDENLLIFNRQNRIALSADVGGFHWYGTDACIQAEILGYSAYVIDFHVLHLGGASLRSSGERGRQFMSDYHPTRRRLIHKYGRALRWRWIQNTGNPMFLSSCSMLNRVLNIRLARSFWKRFGRL